ncbi:MAG TPA: hypothetical protein VGZ04_06930 [Acidimicrobiales bacterium]|jgi:ketosteroid isomerase-like protein|nr:hypothetical protein [Acidimicrobiales bacterium]
MVANPDTTEVDYASRESNASRALDVVNAYLTSFYSGDFEEAKTVVSDDFVFAGPFLQVESKALFFEGAQGLRPIVRGHRLLRQWTDADNVSSIYDVDFETPNGTGSIVMSEWHVIRNDEIVSGRVIFDSAAFRSLVSPT